MHVGRSRVLPVMTMVLLTLAAATTIAQQVGRLTYVEGDVQLLRDGEIREEQEIDIGEAILNLDVIQTGFDGYAEVELTVPSNMTVRIQENAAYYVEQVTGGDRTSVTVRLLSGRLEMAVSELSRGASLSVETQTATLGVRGTEFDVLVAPDEGTLFGVRDGRVEVTAGGRRIAAEAGTAVEALSDRGPRAEPVPDGDFDSYYSTWTEVRLRAFRSGAPTFIRAYARRYLDTRDTFENAYRDLVALRPRLEDAVRQGQRSLGADMRLRSEMSPAIIRMRSVLPMFETTVYRLRELQRFHDQGIGRTQIDERSSTEFFRAFAMEERELLRRLAEVRTIFRLYSEIDERSFGGLPSGRSEDGNSPFGSDGGSLLDSMRF
ncbi:MAG: FecR family protein [Alkalispirochaeta sp.]